MQKSDKWKKINQFIAIFSALSEILRWILIIGIYLKVREIPTSEQLEK